MLGAVVAGLTLLASGAPLCPAAGWLGIPCPGCGLTRATVALATGDWQTAFRLHPLVGFVIPVLSWLGANALRSRRTTGSLASRGLGHRLGNWCGLALAAALVTLWGLRFAGYFGGPVPVTRYADWWRQARTELRPQEQTPAQEQAPARRLTR